MKRWQRRCLIVLFTVTLPVTLPIAALLELWETWSFRETWRALRVETPRLFSELRDGWVER